MGRIKKREAFISTWEHKTDEELMHFYQEGEPAAFEELYFRHSGKVYAFFKARLNQSEAEDLFQNTFMRVHQARARFNVDLPFLPWIFSIARNLLTDHFRKHRPVPLEENKLISLADRRIESEEKRSRASWDEILRLLPDEQKRLIERRFGEEESFEDIARIDAISQVSARKRLNRAIQGLRRHFKVQGGRNEKK